MKIPTLDEQLNKLYAGNGETFQSRHQALNLLKEKGFYFSNGFYRNSKGRKAFLTKIRDSVYSSRGTKELIQSGWLVTFGGNPLPYNQLTFN